MQVDTLSAEEHQLIMPRFECPHCSYWFPVEKKLKLHLLQHTKYRCSSCSYSCFTQGNLTKHTIEHHLPEDGIQQAINARFKCTDKLCQYRCHLKRNLKNHLVKHANNSVFKCSICSYSSDKQSHLSNHVARHHRQYIYTGEEKMQREGASAVISMVYHCPECNFWAKGHEKLHDHLMSQHKEEPSFKCSGCVFTTKFRSRISSHLNSPSVVFEHDVDHRDAKCILLDPIPAHRYAQHLKPARITKGSQTGTFPELDSGSNQHLEVDEP